MTGPELFTLALLLVLPAGAWAEARLFRYYDRKANRR